MTEPQTSSGPRMRKSVDLEFLHLDLTTCTRCTGTDKNLDEALRILAPVLAATGVTLNLHSIHVGSVEEAAAHQLISSPTIRVNGVDIAGALVQTSCSSCRDLRGVGDIDCRVWSYEGEEYHEAPVGLIVEAVLRAAYGGGQRADGPPGYKGVPSNLTRFFGAAPDRTAADPA